MMKSKTKGYFNILFFGLIICNIAFMIILNVYPFIDLPMHLTQATIYRYFGDPDNVFNEYFTIHPFAWQPNTFHFLFCGLKIFPSVEFANKIFICFYILLFPLSVLLLIKKFNGNVWYAVLPFLFLYNFSVTWGFVGFMMGIPSILFFLYFQYDYIFNPNLKNAFIVCVLLVLIYFMHAVSIIFAVVLFLLTVFYFHRKSIKMILLKTAPVLPALLFLFKWWASKPSYAQERNLWEILSNYYKTIYFKTFHIRQGFFYLDNNALFGGPKGIVIGLIITISVIIIAVNWQKLLKKIKKEKIHSDAFQYVFLLLLCSLSFYFIVPSIRGFFQISFLRFSVFAFISIIILGSISAPKVISWQKKLVMVSLTLVHFLLWADYFGDFYRENKVYTEKIMPSTTKEKTLAGLIYLYQFRGQPIYIHFPSYFIIWKKGISPTRITEFKRPWLILRKVGFDKLPLYKEWVGARLNYKGEYRDMDYILLRGGCPRKDIEYFDNFDVVGHINEWYFLRNKNFIEEN